MRLRANNLPKVHGADYWRIRDLRRQYGLTLLEYRAMLDRQGGRCAICGTETCASGNHFSIDHCHRTNRLRGLLCSNCNRGIGLLRDDLTTLRAAAEYLEQHQDVSI